jgi:hypothetical protein
LNESQSFDEAKKIFEHWKLHADDIHEHLDTLLSYAEKSDVITELGVRYIVSTYPFILGKPKKLISVDIYMPSYFLHDNEQTLNHVYDICNGLNIDFKFIQANDLEIELEPMDLLFIDTDHNYEQLSKELYLHGRKCRKWIIMHDTQGCADYSTVNGVITGGLKFAINEFIQQNPEWFVKEVFENNNGLTVLERNAQTQ